MNRIFPLYSWFLSDWIVRTERLLVEELSSEQGHRGRLMKRGAAIPVPSRVRSESPAVIRADRSAEEMSDSHRREVVRHRRGPNTLRLADG